MRRTGTLRTFVVSIVFAVVAVVGAGDVEGEFATVEEALVEALSPSEMASVVGKVPGDVFLLFAPSQSFLFAQPSLTNPVVDFSSKSGGPFLLIDLSALLNAPQPQRAIALFGSGGLINFPQGSNTAPLVLIGINQ